MTFRKQAGSNVSTRKTPTKRQSNQPAKSFETVLMVSAHPDKLYILSSSALDSLSSYAIEAANTFQE